MFCSNRCASHNSIGAGGSPGRRKRFGLRVAAASREPRFFPGTLAEAEATLACLREHQIEADAAEAAFDALDAATGPVAVAEKLSAEGFGPRLKPNAADVLARLRERAAGGKPEAGA